MTIIPDDKDWTWVLDRACPECGTDVSTMDAADTIPLLRRTTAAWVDVLTEPGRPLAERPSAHRWSPLEYACHVRDCYRLYTARLGLMLDEDDPLFPNWDQDVSAVEDRYNEQDPAVVAADLGAAGAELADAFAAVTGDQWQRPGRRSDGASFTVDTFARYFVHDPVHHLWDVGRPLT